jgi:hypothetical protein
MSTTNDTNMSSDDDDSSEFIDDADMYSDEDAFNEAFTRRENKRERERQQQIDSNPYLNVYRNNNVDNTNVSVNRIQVPKFEFRSLEELFASLFKEQRKYNSTINQSTTQWYQDILYSGRNIDNNVLIQDKNKIIPEIDITFTPQNCSASYAKIIIGEKTYDLSSLPKIIDMYSNLFPNETRYIPFNVTLTKAFEKDNSRHANCLVYDKKENKAYYYEPHGSYFYDFDYKWASENVFCILYNLLKKHGIEVIPPYVNTPYIYGLQYLGNVQYKKNELEGYCMLWSSLIIFILHYTNLPEIDTSLNIQKIVNYSRIIYTNNCSTDNLIVQKIIQGYWLFLNTDRIKNIFNNHMQNLVNNTTQNRFYSLIPFYSFYCSTNSFPLQSIVRVRSLNGDCRDKKVTIHYTTTITTIPENARPNRIDIQQIHQTFGSILIQQDLQQLPETYEEIYEAIDTIKNEILSQQNNNSGSSISDSFMMSMMSSLPEKKRLLMYERTYYQETTVLSRLFDLYKVKKNNTISDSKTYKFGGIIIKCHLFLQIINFLCSSDSEGVIYFPYKRNNQMIYFINDTIDDLQSLLYAYNLTHDCKYHVEHELTTDETDVY